LVTQLEDEATVSRARLERLHRFEEQVWALTTYCVPAVASAGMTTVIALAPVRHWVPVQVGVREGFVGHWTTALDENPGIEERTT
jgi:hypothetical protein